MTSSNLRPLLLGLLVPALLPCGCEATGQGQVVQCRVDPECPVGSFCIGGACLPGEYDPLPRTDLGPDEPDGAADLGPADQGPPPPDGGEPDGGAVDGGEPDGGGGGEIRPLLLSWMLPADGSRLEGEAELQLELQTDPRIGTRLLTLFVDDVEVARQARPDPAAPVSLRLDTTLFADGHHQLDAEVQDLTGRTARAGGRTLLFVNQPDRLQVEEGGFLLDGAPVGLVGVEYAPPLDQVTLDADLAAMAAAGINLVAVTAPAVAVEPAENHFTPEGCEPVSMLLQSSLAQGIRVVLRLPSYEAYPYLHPQPGAPAGPAALLWDGKLRAALARRHVNLLERCGWTGQEALAALDLWQRPRAGSDEAHAALLALASWETWSLARHGSAEARLAAWGPAADLSCGLTGEAACPPPLAELCLPGNGGVGGPTALVVDYRLYLDELGARALTDLAAKVGFADPAVLLTASLEAPLAGPALPSREACAVDGGPLDPRQAGEALDFLLLVGDPWDGVPVSPLEAAPLAAEFADHASDFDLFEISALWARGHGARPVLLAGFSGDAQLAGGAAAGELVQAGVWSRTLQAAQALALSGVVGRSWRDAGEEATGLLRADGTPRAALAVVTQEGTGLRTPSAWSPDSWVAIPRERVHLLAEAVLLAHPFYLPLRTGGKQPAATSCLLEPPQECLEVRGCADLCGVDPGDAGEGEGR